MIFDLQSMFSDDQAVTTTAVSENVIDFGAVDTPQHAVGPITRDLGLGRPVPVEITVSEDFAGLTSLRVDLQIDDDEAFGSAETVVTGATIAAADLVAGKKIGPFYMPEGVDKRYARLNYTVVGTATAGKITAGLAFGRARWTA